MVSQSRARQQLIPRALEFECITDYSPWTNTVARRREAVVVSPLNRASVMILAREEQVVSCTEQKLKRVCRSKSECADRSLTRDEQMASCTGSR